MKTCDYCGKSNEDLSLVCGGCGTEFPTEEASQVETDAKPPAPPGILTAGRAAIILLIFLAANFFWAVFITTFKGPDFVLTPQSILCCTLFSSIIAINAAFKVVPASVRDTSPTGTAWVRGPWMAIMKCLPLGIAISAFSFLLSYLIPSRTHQFHWDPLLRMSYTRGWPQAIAFVLAVIIAPPVEELLFRGVLYGGLRKSFGVIWSGFLTTLLFVALHIPNFNYPLRDTFFVTTIAIATLWARLRWKAIGPAIAIHLGYNATLMLSIIFRI